MHDHRHARALPAGLAVAALALPAPAEGAVLTTVTVTHLRAPGKERRVAGEPRPLEALVPPAAAATSTVPTAGLTAPEPVATLLLAIVLLVGLAGIAAWIWSSLGRPAPTTEQEPTPRLELLRSPGVEDDTGRRPVLGYVALAWGDPAGDLESAACSIGRWCEESDWPLARVVHDAPGESGRARSRPGLAHALEEVGAGRVAGLVVARLRDLTESVAEIGPLLQWFADSEAFVIALDYRLDTASAPGRFAAWTLVEISEWERGRLTGRTRPGLDAARRGAAVRDDPELSARIAAMRRDGMSLQAIADALNADGIPTLRGGSRWRPSSVQAAAGYRRPPVKPRGVELPPLRQADAGDGDAC
jgi:DNA invertase Pin-like site-specific DNA recombinase